MTKTIDRAAVTGWFTEDFTLAELKTLHARKRLGAMRPEAVRELEHQHEHHAAAQQAKGERGASDQAS